MRTAFSVIISTYNGEQYIEEQLQSINEQTYKPLEVIISDDGSTDRTLEILQTFNWCCEISVRYIYNQSNVGFRRNFVNIARLASNEWICFSDQDDIWDKKKLAKLSEQISIYGSFCKVFIHSFVVLSEKLEIKNRVVFEDKSYAPGEFDAWQTIPGMAMCFHKDLCEYFYIQAVLFDMTEPNQVISHDQLVLHIGNIFFGIRTMSDILISYRRHEGAVSYFLRPGRMRNINWTALHRRYDFSKKMKVCQFNGPWQANLSLYEMVIKNLTEYQFIETSDSPRKRLKKIVHNIACGAYMHLGFKQMIKDAICLFYQKNNKIPKA